MAGLNLQDIINQNKQNNNNLGAGATNSTETKVQQEKFIVTMIPVEKLHDNVKNSFGLREVENLADSILLLGGIKQNLVVREREDGEYTVVAGHKRKAAVEMLIKQGKTEYRLVPCKIENYIKRTEELENNSDENSVNPDVLEELDLIFTNTTQREQTIQERMTAVKRLRELIPQLPGMEDVKERTLRKLIADTMKLSEGSIATIDNINRNLCKTGVVAFGENKINLETAKELAGLTEQEQEKFLEQENLTAREVKEYKKEKEEDKTRLTGSEREILYRRISKRTIVAKIRYERNNFIKDFIEKKLKTWGRYKDEEVEIASEDTCMRVVNVETGEVKRVAHEKVAQQVLLDYENDRFKNDIDDSRIENNIERQMLMDAISETARVFKGEYAERYNTEIAFIKAMSTNRVMDKEEKEKEIKQAILKIVFDYQIGKGNFEKFLEQSEVSKIRKPNHRQVIFYNPAKSDKGICLYNSPYADQPIKNVSYESVINLVSEMARLEEYAKIEIKKQNEVWQVDDEDEQEEVQKEISNYKNVLPTDYKENYENEKEQKAADETRMFLTDNEVKNILKRMISNETRQEEKTALRIALDRFDKYNQ